MKKLLLILLSVVMIFSFSACGDTKDKEEETTTEAKGSADNATGESDTGTDKDTEYKICNDIGEQIGSISEEVLEDGSKYVIEYSYEDEDYKYEFNAPSGIKYGYIMDGMASFSDELQTVSIAVYTMDMTSSFKDYDEDIREEILAEIKSYSEEELATQLGISDTMENKEIVFDDNKIIIKGELESGKQKGMMVMELEFDEVITSKMYTYLSMVEDYETEEAKTVLDVFIEE